MCYIILMWSVLYTDEFETWWESLTKDEQDQIAAAVELLEEYGPNLSRPLADTLKGSKYDNMKELRTQYHGDPFRTFFAFDPKQNAILLIGGCKAGDKRFYKKMIPKADKLYAQHLKELESE
jgi:hypothetical protein